MGSSGAFALYVGRDRLLGPSFTSSNGLVCSDVNLVTIRKQDRVWIRKYITTDTTDGLTRVKTALRVARAVYDAQKPDLVQVVVLDRHGPTLRSDIRGRALGADVVYVPDVSKIEQGTVDAPYTARYYDGAANDEGLFYGERVDMPLADINGVIASLKDDSDCENPVSTEAATGDEGSKPKKKVDKAENAEKVDHETTGSVTPGPQAAH